MDTVIDSTIDVNFDTNNWGFILFLICFLITVIIVSNRNRFLNSIFYRLYQNKDRKSVFYQTVTYENFNKIFLSIQTIILTSIIIYCYAVHESFLSVASFTQMLQFIGKCSFILMIYLLYKFLSYSIIGAIFFKKETVIHWNEAFFSLISIDGIILFIPTLIIFYVDKAYYFCIYFFIFYLFFNIFFIFYKIYVLFFRVKLRFLYFILYLCAQEIIPLYLVYRSLIYLITQKDTIWI